jgi:hypothetical protein
MHRVANPDLFLGIVKPLTPALLRSEKDKCRRRHNWLSVMREQFDPIILRHIIFPGSRACSPGTLIGRLCSRKIPVSPATPNAKWKPRIESQLQAAKALQARAAQAESNYTSKYMII